MIPKIIMVFDLLYWRNRRDKHINTDSFADFSTVNLGDRDDRLTLNFGIFW